MFLHAVICSRAVCAMLSCNPCSQSLKNPECRVPWSRFCIDPWSAAEELHDRGCIKRSKSYLYFHMADQYHCMRTAQGDWAVDFIGRVDEPDEDWPEVRSGSESVPLMRCCGPDW
jgi:hypothetical protein